MTKHNKITSSNHSVLKQVCNHNPGHALGRSVRKHGDEDAARTFDCWSHQTILVFSQLSYNFGPKDLCDQTDIHWGFLRTFRGARTARRYTPPTPTRGGRPRQAPVPRPAREASQGHSHHRLHDDVAGGQLHGLGLASTPQGRRQGLRATEHLWSLARLLQPGHCPGGRQPAITVAHGGAKTERNIRLGQREPLTAMCGVAGAPEPSEPAMGGAIGPVLRADVSTDARFHLAGAEHSGAAGPLWDGEGRLQGPRGSIAGFLGGISMNTWEG